MIETLGTDEIFKREDAEKRRELRVEHQKMDEEHIMGTLKE